MSLQEILTGGGVSLFVLLTLVQIAPVKINPWSKLAKAIGNALNGGDVMAKLEEHIRIDDERDADMHRARILQFNTELLRDAKHTEEDFNEILYNIDCYERYCREHPEYQNNRAVHAIRNIKRVFDERMEKHDFLLYEPRRG